MNTDLAKRMIDEADDMGIPALKFNWRGESTLHQDFTEILKYANHKKSFYDIIVNTNGNVPDHAMKGLLYTSKVVVSVDAFGKDTYRTMRKGGDIRTVCNTINYLIEHGHDNIWIRRVITKKNQQEEFVQIAKDAFGDKVKISEHYCFDRNKKETHQTTKKTTKRLYCGYPSQRLVIATDGMVYPCCVDYDESMPVGDVSKMGLMDIWQSPKMVDLRFLLRKKQFEPWMDQCENCTSWMSYDSIERQFIQDRAVR